MAQQASRDAARPGWHAQHLTAGELSTKQVAPGIERILLSSRLTRLQGMVVTPYLVGGKLLVDSGFAHVRHLVLEHLAGRSLEAIALTHHHEDHAANSGPLAAAHDCPIYLMHPELRWTEGAERLPSYRQLWWGASAPYEPQEMPALLEVGPHRLRTIPTPGHSATHAALYDEHTGTLFSGDLYIASGASAVMTHEDPYLLARSLRQVATLSPAVMLSGHGKRLEHPESWLCTKAARVEEAAALSVRLRGRGLPTDEIVRRVFPRRGRTKDLWGRAMTAGEFSRRNFVRAAIEHEPR